MNHPSIGELALLASRDLGFARRARVSLHLRKCPDCREAASDFGLMRKGIAHMMPPDLDWDSLASEMRANIRLGLEAGACVGSMPEVTHHRWSPKLAVALASLVALAGSGVFFARQQHRTEAHDSSVAVLRSTSDGVEVRSGSNSLELLNRKASVANQTVGAEGQIGMRYVDDTGAVTINNVYLQ